MNCTICKCKKITHEKFLSRNDNIIDLLQCKSCGHWWQSKKKEIGNNIYSDGTYAEIYRDVTKKYISNNNNNSQSRLRYYENFFNNIKNALEVGSGIGSFVNLLRLKGVDAIGIEPDNTICKLSKNIYGFSQKPITIEKFNTTKKFERIYSFHVLEHVNDPHMFFKKIKKLLVADSGQILIECPSLEIHKKGNLQQTIWEPHLHYFTLLSLYILVSKYMIVDKIGFYKSSLFVIGTYSQGEIKYNYKLKIISSSIFYFYRSKNRIINVIKYFIRK
jgi:SAM-dependent methyltransferase